MLDALWSFVVTVAVAAATVVVFFLVSGVLLLSRGRAGPNVGSTAAGKDTTNRPKTPGDPTGGASASHDSLSWVNALVSFATGAVVDHREGLTADLLLEAMACDALGAASAAEVLANVRVIDARCTLGDSNLVAAPPVPPTQQQGGARGVHAGATASGVFGTISSRVLTTSDLMRGGAGGAGTDTPSALGGSAPPTPAGLSPRTSVGRSSTARGFSGGVTAHHHHQPQQPHPLGGLATAASHPAASAAGTSPGESVGVEIHTAVHLQMPLSLLVEADVLPVGPFTSPAARATNATAAPTAAPAATSVSPVPPSTTDASASNATRGVSPTQAASAASLSTRGMAPATAHAAADQSASSSSATPSQLRPPAPAPLTAAQRLLLSLSPSLLALPVGIGVRHVAFTGTLRIRVTSTKVYIAFDEQPHLAIDRRVELGGGLNRLAGSPKLTEIVDLALARGVRGLVWPLALVGRWVPSSDGGASGGIGRLRWSRERVA